MFPNLNAELARKKLTVKSLSEITGINYESLKNKASGKTEFKRSEMYRIKKDAFPEYSIDYLFAESNLIHTEKGVTKHGEKELLQATGR